MEKRTPERKDLITRRSFMKGAAYGSLGFAAGLHAFGRGAEHGQAGAPFAVADPLARLVLVRDEKAVGESHAVDAAVVAAMVDRAVCGLSGETDPVKAWQYYVSPSDTVGVKVTRCEWMRVHTHEAVSDAVVSGLTRAGVPKDRIHVKDGGLPFKECTVLVNVPTIKVHTLTGMACSMKNYINLSGKASAYHFNGKATLGEIFLLPDIKGKTRLILVDALVPYFGPGPQINPLHQWDYKGIMAGTDPVAVDTTALRLCETKRRLFKGEPWPITPPPRFIAVADKDLKLGTSDPARIKVDVQGWTGNLLLGT